jgi:hypothetical protein
MPVSTLRLARAEVLTLLKQPFEILPLGLLARTATPRPAAHGNGLTPACRKGFLQQ